jgi:hypothetical protein
MIITKTIAASGLSLLINGVPVQANLLNGAASGCDMSAQTAKQWRNEGAFVVEQRVGVWCVAGTVREGVWLAEQWQEGLSSDRRSRGWLIKIPLSQPPGARRKSPHTVQNPWALDVFDSEIKARVRYRQSLAEHDAHHRKSLAISGKGALVITQPHPDGGSYSVAIERGAQP